METQVKVNEEAILHKLAVYMFLQKFYSGELNKINRTIWEQISDLMNEEISFFLNEKMKKGIQIISELNTNDMSELEFDFNRLFVGPNRLEASPYESTYRNTERAVMQTETMAVRRFYEKVGLVVSKKNIDPDDHISLELEFVCYLLKESVENDAYYTLYEAFLKEHLFEWAEEHCELIREKTENNLIIGISYILQGLMEVERKQLNVRRRSKK
jgi:TorA maturation chaperone TorD